MGEVQEVLRCLLVRKGLTEIECKMICAVFEETAPLSELPVEVDFTDSKQNVCLNCPHHATN